MSDGHGEVRARGDAVSTPAGDFPSSSSRSFTYFQPQRLKATVYEDVTVDVQPDPSRYLTQDWAYGFADGPGGYPSESTAARCSDWHRFRDPNQEWEQSIFKNNARLVGMVAMQIENARDHDAFERWSATWWRVVERHLGAWMHVPQGIGMHVFLPAQRDAPTNMINNAIAVNAIHKLRIAQDLALFNLEASEALPGFDGRAHLDAWNHDAIWQPVRESAERLTAIRDWCEAVVAVNLAFEPLVGELFRIGCVMAIAPTLGDFVSPSIMAVAQRDFERDLAYTKTLIGGLTHDELHGEANRELFERWLSLPISMSMRAARTLEPIWSECERSPADFQDALARVRTRLRLVLEELAIRVPEELDR